MAAGIAHVCIEGIEAEALLFLLDAQGLRASAASSCSSGAQDPSHVLAAMGVPRALAAGSLRLSLGHTTTAADIDAALDIIPAAVARLAAHGGG
ncbi:MAG: aminotransferase class V-fold PLP-dependent enzyme [Acidimicrobiales bacterium]